MTVDVTGVPLSRLPLSGVLLAPPIGPVVSGRQQQEMRKAGEGDDLGREEKLKNTL